MSASTELAIKLTGSPGNVQQVMDGVTKSLGGIPNVAKGVTSALGSIVDGLGKIGLAGMGIKTLADGAKGLGDALGVGLNSQMEQVTASLNAFTKDGNKSAAILADIRKEAALTPFAFQEMANATAALLPVSKASGAGLMDLVKQAEILAASNPLQGLEGASFALKEAVSGDFTSVIERFNLSRSTINKLKDEGVPALQIVSRAMAEMGLDSDLIAAKAETLDGRWSTFLDTLDGLRATIGQPIFDALKEGLMSVQSLLDGNTESIQAFADGVASNIKSAIVIVQALFAAFTIDAGAMGIVIAQLRKMFGDDFADAIEPFIQGFMAAIPAIKQFVTSVFQWFGMVGDIIKQAFSGDVLEAFTSFLDVMANLGIKIAELLAGWGKAFVEWIGPMIPPFLAQLGIFATGLLAWLGDQVPALQAKLLEWGQALVDWIGPMIPPLLAKLGEWMGSIVGWIKENAGPVKDQLVEWGAAFVDWISEAVPPMLEKLSAFAVSLLDKIAPMGDDLAKKAEDALIPAIVDWAVKAIPALIGAFFKLKTAFEVEIGKIAIAAGMAALRIGVQLMEGIQQGIGQLDQWLKGQMGQALMGLLEAARGVIDAHSPSRVWNRQIGRPMAEGIGEGFEEGMPEVEDTITSALTGMVDSVSDVAATAAGGIGGSMADAVANSFLAAVPRATAAIRQAVAGLVPSTGGKVPQEGQVISAGMTVGTPEQIAAGLAGMGSPTPVHNILVPQVNAPPPGAFMPDFPRSFTPGSGSGGGGSSFVFHQTNNGVSKDVDMEGHNNRLIDKFLNAQRYQDAAGSRQTVIQVSQ